MVNFIAFDNLLDAVFIFNEKREVVYCNEAAATLCGTSLKRMKPGKFVYDFLTFKDETLFFMPQGTEGRNEDLFYKEVGYINKQSKESVGLVSIKPLQMQNGDPIWMLTCRDMSLEIELHEKHHVQLEELKKYSTNLEKMVEDRTLELKKTHTFMNTMVNSLDQGLMVFDRECNCLPVYTKACEVLLGMPLENKKVWDLFKLDKLGTENFQKWVTCLFDEILPFKDMLPLGVTSLVEGSNWADDNYKCLSLDYFPMRESEDSPLIGVVTVATDKTAEIKAKKAMEEQEAYVKMVLKILHHKDQFKAFVKDGKQMLHDMKESVNASKSSEIDIALIMRLLHSIKGCSSLYSLFHLQTFAHDLESFLAPLKEASSEKKQETLATLGENLLILEELFYDAVNEAKKIIGDFESESGDTLEISKKELVLFAEHLKSISLERVAKKFESLFLTERIDSLFLAYSDLLQSVAEKLLKEVHPLVIIGGDLRVYTEYYSELASVIVHLFRNSIDHGIESPEAREQAGKGRQGTIKLEFKIEHLMGQDRLVILLSDDGAGIDTEKIRAKLLANNRAKEATSATDQEILYTIFESSFSTKDNVTELSGRGVGLDAVKTVVESLGGTITIKSNMGVGTEFKIIVPLKISKI